ncbi:MAG: type II secretion system F family protein [Phycisphaerae bacterium]|nr:type II secretion system F family protein [Phycisphaerae bacterium]
MDWLVLLGMVVIAAALVIYSLVPKRREDYSEAVRRRSAGLDARGDAKSLESKAKQRAAGKQHTATNKVFELAAPILSRPVMPKNAEEQSTLKAKLASAGFRKESTPVLFLASKTAAAFACGVIGAVLASSSGKDMLAVAGYAMAGFGVGFMLPNLWLSLTIGRRSEAIRNGLPDSLDLMVVAVESGLALDAAIQRVSDEMGNVHVALAEEFQIASVETQMGVPRAEALSKMADRTAVSEMRALVAVISQAEKLGTSIASALRVQAESLRTKRRQKAEERAQKTAVKLLLPLILFIFPTIFVVLAGPAALQLIKNFSGGVGK